MSMVLVCVQRSELIVLVYLRPCGIGGRVGLVLEPGVLIGAVECFLGGTAVLSCIGNGLCSTGKKNQEKRQYMPLTTWYTKTISLEFLHHKRSVIISILISGRRPDISCTQLDRISLCKLAQGPESFGRRRQYWGLN